MTGSRPTQRYGALSIGLHWLMLLLIVAVYACMELRGLAPRGSALRASLKQWHFMLGLSVLLLVALRLAARLLGGTPPISPAPPPWQERLSRLMHLVLYALMVGMPVAGWLALSAAGKPIPFFFGLQLPALIAENQDLAETIEELHEAGASLGYFLIGAHAAAALFHHYVMGDNTLRRMLPARR